MTRDAWLIVVWIAALLLLPGEYRAFAQFGENGDASSQEGSPEAPLPPRIPENRPPSPEVPLPDASELLRENRIRWIGDIDPDLTWIGAPWDYIPPVDDRQPPAGMAVAPESAANDEPAPATRPPAAASRPPEERSSEAEPTEVTPPEAEPTGPRTAAPAPQQPQRPPDVTQNTEPRTTPPETAQPPVFTATVEEVIPVSLPGTGWIFVGSLPREADIDLVESQSGAGQTVFRFRPWQTGDILLSFQRQDVVSGSFEESTIELAVLEEGAPASAGTPGEPMPPTAPMVPAPPEDASEPQEMPELTLTIDGDGDYGEAEALFAEGRQLAALESYLSHYDGSGSPVLHDRMASLASDLGYDDIAVYFWNQNLHLPSALGTSAREQLTASRIGQTSLSELEDHFTLLRNYGELPPAEQLFAWAQAYDIDGPTPEVRRAMLLYDALVDWYPAAPEASRAEARLRFLQRHFLEVR